MTTLTQAIVAKMEADGTLAGILTGGIYDANDLDRKGLTISDTITDDRGRLNPVAVVRGGGGSAFGPHFGGQTRFVSIYFYEYAGTTTIEAAMLRAKTILHRTQVDLISDGYGLSWINWFDDGREFVDEALGGASGMWSRYQIFQTRL